MFPIFDVLSLNMFSHTKDKSKLNSVGLNLHQPQNLNRSILNFRKRRSSRGKKSELKSLKTAKNAPPASTPRSRRSWPPGLSRKSGSVRRPWQRLSELPPKDGKPIKISI